MFVPTTNLGWGQSRESVLWLQRTFAKFYIAQRSKYKAHDQRASLFHVYLLFRFFIVKVLVGTFNMKKASGMDTVKLRKGS